MWSKNGEEYLPRVLTRIDKVIPTESIHKRILVDDYSMDNTIRIAKDFNWHVYLNPKGGISSGANEALKYVESDCFISVEQDVILSEDWWLKVPAMLKGNVVIASGVRLPNKPLSLRKLQEYTTERYRREIQHKTSSIYGKTLDNTIYKTAAMKRIGGFPEIGINAGIDNVLAKRIFDIGLNWIVNYDVVSTHIRNGIIQELKHYYWYGTCQKKLKKAIGTRGDQFFGILLRTGFSPIRGIQVAYKQRCWQIAYVYPLMRISSFLGLLRGYL
jgi:glycosyltransferase involved in cell wall biosynthesis